MMYLQLVAPREVDYDFIAALLKNCSSQWTVWSGESSLFEGELKICVSIGSDFVPEDYCQLTPALMDFSDEDYPLERAKADDELYRRHVPDYQLFSVEYFRAPARNLMIEVLMEIDSACSGVVVDNCNGVIAFLRALQHHSPYPDWETCKSHPANLA